MIRGAVLALVAVLSAACGGSAFRFSMVDNDKGELATALGRRQLPASPQPVNAAHQPRAFVAVGGPHPSIVAFDLAGGKVLWRQPAELGSRIAVGGAFVAAVEGGAVVARDQSTGAPLWRHDIPGGARAFEGLAADASRAYLVAGDTAHDELTALDGASGKQLWAANADGTLGAPAANGGEVYVPYYQQWLAILDGATGAQLARVRSTDGQIPMLFATGRDAYYGAKDGVYRLDPASASGTRAGSTFRKIAIPPELEHTQYGPDAYDAVQRRYTAADRARILWSGTLGDAGYAIDYFRFVFGFDPHGELVWAYSHPRTELVAAAFIDNAGGSAIVGIAQNGEVVALDARTGTVLAQSSLGGSDPVLGATFDADGWTPGAAAPAAPDPAATTQALVSILRDRDARFDRVKELALHALATRPGGDVTRELLEVFADPRAPGKLAEDIVPVLAARKDPDSLPELTRQLAVRYDFITKTSPLALGPIAKAIAALGAAKDIKLDPTLVGAAVTALEAHLDDPATPAVDLADVIGALAAIGGGGAERTALTSHLLLYHADARLAADPVWVKAITEAVVGHGGPAEHEIARAVAADPRTAPELATALRDALTAD